MLPGSQHFEGQKGVLEFQDGTRKSDKHQLLTWICTKPTQGGQCLVRALLVLGRATGKLGLTRLTTARTWGKPPPSPLQYTLCLSTRPTSKWLFVPRLPSGSPEIAKIKTFATLGPHNFVCKPPIEMSLKQSCSPRRELSNGMWHLTCTQGNRIDSRLLMVRSQVANLTFKLFFDHNLCFRCPNGLYEPILDI